MPESSSLTVDVVALLRRPGGRRTVPVLVDLADADHAAADHAAGDDADADGWGISSAAVDRVAGDLSVESMADSLTVSGSVAVSWHGACRRCLERAEGVLDVDVHEIYERRPTEGETYPIGDHSIDLAPMLRELVVLALPLAPLCGAECAGPDPERFPALVAPDVEPEVPIDPRWAALGAIRFDE